MSGRRGRAETYEPSPQWKQRLNDLLDSPSETAPAAAPSRGGYDSDETHLSVAPPPAPAAEDDGGAPHNDGSGDGEAFAPPEEDEDEDARSSTPASLTTLGSAADALVETTRRHGGYEVILRGNAPVGIIRDGQRGMWFGELTTERSRGFPQVYEMSLLAAELPFL